MIRLKGTEKIYGEGVQTFGLRATDLTIESGELVVILGPSGSGKTTLLNLIGGLDKPSAGSIEVEGSELTGLSPKALTEFRRRQIGFVFQFFNLIPTLTAEENVAFAAELARTKSDARKVLDAVGLKGHEDRFPGELSGGQQQRVAIARALAKEPPLLLCDEPTGALDVETGKQVLSLLADQAREHGRTVIIVTHNTPVADMGDRVLRLRDGHVVDDQRNERPSSADNLAW